MVNPALNNALVLPLLGVLLEAPRHLYGLAAALEARLSTGGLSTTRASVRNLLGPLLERGLIRVQGQEQAGRRPVRTVYELTGAGVQDLRRRVTEQLVDVRPDHDHFTQAVAYLGLLGPAGAVETLGRRAQALEARLEGLAQAHRQALDQGVPEVFVIEADFVIGQLRAERDWVSACRERIRSGGLPWPA